MSVEDGVNSRASPAIVHAPAFPGESIGSGVDGLTGPSSWIANGTHALVITLNGPVSRGLRWRAGARRLRGERGRQPRGMERGRRNGEHREDSSERRDATLARAPARRLVFREGVHVLECSMQPNSG